MDSDSPNLDTIFCDAIEKASAEERAAYIAQACGCDHELRGQVERLVGAHFQAGSFLEQPVVDVGATSDDVPPGCWINPADPPPPGKDLGSRIGPYKLMEQIGEGGMGLVFVAQQQQPVRRKVALKVIKPGMDTRQVIARFEVERQALALMDHPNIAKVLDGGETTSGLPYFVMELVKGVTITEYCDQNQVPIRPRLELFVSVCQAVQHAHQKGIIHRDLKPSNVLVVSHDGTPVAKVIDFGVAKAIGQHLTDKTIYTQFAQMVGTPLYMSPEQAGQSGLDVDTRSDIYSLGVLLYELMTGTTPFGAQRMRALGYDEMRRIIREEEPPKPSTRISTLGQAALMVSARRQSDPKRLSQLFRGELDWIVMKCLEKDRNRRYETASALASDVRRYLHDEPVQACPPSAGYRLKKFLKRHRRPVLAAGVVVLGLVVGIAGTVAGLVRARDEAARARQAQNAEADQHQRAQENLRLALRVMDEIYLQIAEERVPRDPQQQRQEHELLKKALAFYQEFAAHNSADPVVAAEVARARRRVGDIQRLVGQHAEARSAYLGAIEQAEQLDRDFPGQTEYAPELAACRNALAELELEMGELTSATEHFHQAADALAALTGDLAALPGCRAELARSQYGLGLVLKQRGDRLGAEAEFRKTIDLQASLAEDFPDVAQYRADLAQMHRSAGRWVAMGPGDDQAAAEHLRTAVKLIEQLAKDFPAEPLYRQRLALALQDLGIQVGPTVESIQRSIEIQKQLAAEYPKVPAYRGDLGVSHTNLGYHYYFAGQLDLAAEHWRQSLAIWAKLEAEVPGVTRHTEGFAFALYNWAELVCVRDKDFRQVGRLLDQALGTFRPLVKAYPRNQMYARALVSMSLLRADNVSALGDPGEAARQLGEAGEAFGDTVRVLQGLPNGSSRVAGFCREIGEDMTDFANVWAKAGRPAEAAAARRHIAEIYDRAIALDAQNPVLWTARGDAWQQLGEMNKALADYREAVALLEKAGQSADAADRDKELASALYNLAGLLKTRNSLREAAEASRQAVALRRKLAAHFPEEPTYRVELGHSLWRLGEVTTAAPAVGQHGEAEKAYREALATFEKLAQDFPHEPNYQLEAADTCWGRLGPLLAGQAGRLKDAEKVYRQGLSLHEKLLANFPSNWNYNQRLGNNYWQLMNLLKKDQRLGEASQVGRQGVDFYERLAARHPQEPDLYQEFVRRSIDLADVLREAGRSQEAEQAFQHVLALSEKLIADPRSAAEGTRWHLGCTYEALGHALKNAGKRQEATKAFRHALAVWERLVTELNKEDHRWHLGCIQEEVGHLLKEADRLDEAARSYRQALAVWQKLVADRNKDDHRSHLSRSQGWLQEVLARQARQGE